MVFYHSFRDLEAYKKILDVFPKGRFIPENIFQAEFLHFPKQQFCAVDLLEQMEENAVIPDEEMGLMLRNIFGKNAVPRRKYMRMMYWMPKFKHLSPWALPDPVPDDSLDLAKLAMERLGSVDVQSIVTTLKVSDLIFQKRGLLW
jgi:signaling intermediate in Toll pathway protein